MNKIMLGIVENNNSPNKDGRVQVRIPMIHPQKDSSTFEEVRTEDLPWLEIVSQGFLNQGIGISHVPEIGQWVHVLVPENLDNMLVLGIMRSGSDSFNQYSKGKGERRLEPIEVEHKSVQIQEPPELDSKTIYPNSTSFYSRSGHLMMSDDTSDNERIKIEHRSGQFIEFRPDGSFVLRTPKDGYTIIEGDFNQYIKGEVNKIIEGQVNVAIKEQIKFEVSKAFIVEQDGSITLKSDQNINLEQGQGINIEQSDNVVIKGQQIQLN